MKKLMIIAAVAFAAVAAQAANWRWTAANIYDGTGTSASKLASGTAVYIFTSATTMQTVLDNYATSGWLADNAIASGSLNSAGQKTAASTDTDFSYGEAQKYTFYLAIVDDGMLYLSNTKDATGTTMAGSTPIAFGSQAASSSGTYSKDLPITSGTATAGHWHAVPEPTSGLLLLLGMAGLALRRRRA